MPAPNRRLTRPVVTTIAHPRLILLPALHPDADPRAALLPAWPRAAPVLFASMADALAELRRLQGAAS